MLCDSALCLKIEPILAMRSIDSICGCYTTPHGLSAKLQVLILRILTKCPRSTASLRWSSMISKRWITLPLWALLSPRSDNYTLKLVNIHNLGAPCGLESSIENGIGTLANLSLAEALKDKEQFDTLFIPGRFGVMPLVWDFILLQQIGQLVDCAAHAFTICTAAMLLAAAGRLDGRKATTNQRLYDEITPKCTCTASP